MGGVNTTNQVRLQVMETSTNILNEAITKVTNTTAQTASVQQVIKSIRVERTPLSECPAWAPPGPVSIVNHAGVNMAAFTSLSALSSTDLTNQLTDKVNTAFTAAVNKQRDGMLASNESTNFSQTDIIDVKTKTDIRNHIETKLGAWKKQTGSAQQVIADVVIPQPCGSVPSLLTNDGVVEMVSKDLAGVATEAIMKSQKMTDFTTNLGASDTQKSTDIFGQFRDMVTGVFSSVFGSGTIIIIAIVLFIPLTLWALSKMLGGGGAAPIPAFMPPPAGTMAAGAVPPAAVSDVRSQLSEALTGRLSGALSSRLGGGAANSLGGGASTASSRIGGAAATSTNRTAPAARRGSVMQTIASRGRK